MVSGYIENVIVTDISSEESAVILKIKVGSNIITEDFKARSATAKSLIKKWTKREVDLVS